MIPPEDEFNTIFGELVPETDRPLEGIVAYGLYKVAKREWIIEFNARHSRRPTPEEVAAYARSFTSSRLDGLRIEAQGVLGEYAQAVIADARPDIEKAALRGSSWKALGLNMAAAFLYTLLLIAGAAILKFSGVDLLSILGSVSTKGGG